MFFPERIIRYPEKHLVGALVLLCALAGAGLTALHERLGRAAAAAFAVACALLAFPVTMLALLRTRMETWLRPGAVLVPGLDPGAALDVALRAGVIALAVAATASLCFIVSTRRRWAGVVAVGVVALHLLYEGWAVTPVFSAERLSRRPKLLERLGPAAGHPTARPPPRILRSPGLNAEIAPEAQAIYRHETLLLDSPGRFGVAAVPGFEGWRSREFAALWSRARAMPLASFQTLFAIDAVVLPSELRQTLFPSGSGRGEGVVAQLMLDVGSEDGAWSLVRSDGIRPRAFVAPRWRWSSSEGALAATVDAARMTDPGLVVLTGTGASSPPGNEGLPLAPCEIASYEPDRVELSCASPAGGFAVLVEENAPGWTAAVDETPAKLETADVLLRAVAVGPGNHRIVFSYRAPFLRTGLAVSALAWIGWLAVLRRARSSRA